MKATQKALFGLSCSFLLGLLLFFLAFSMQPCYQSGMAITLQADGFRIYKLAKDSPAEKAGLHADMLLTRVGEHEAGELSTLSVRDLDAFLRVSSRLFASTGFLELRGAEGARYTLTMEPLSLGKRLPILPRTVISNIVVAAFFVVFAIWLSAIAKTNEAAAWFLGFCLSAAAAIALSFFSSYWSPFFLAFRFIGLDLTGAAAAFFLTGFLFRFPERKPLPLAWMALFPAFFFSLKYALIAVGYAKPYGLAAYGIHLYLAASLLNVVLLLTLRYRTSSAGGRRKLRWLMTGFAASLIPYIVYMLSVLFRASMVSNTPDIMNYVASFGILLFPLSVAIGIKKYSLFDIDRLINRFALLFFLILAATLAYTLIFVVFLGRNFGLELYFSILATLLIAPPVYGWIDAYLERLLWKNRKDKSHILVEMEQALNGLTKAADVYEVMSSALISAFYPLDIEILERDGPRASRYHFPKELARDHGEAKALPGGPGPGSREAGLELDLGTVGDATLSLRLGPRRDEDIYTKYDRLLLAGACAQIGKALQNCALYAQLQESLANESRAQRTAILTLAKLTEYRDNETGRHLERIQTYARLLAKQYRFLNLEAGYMSDEYIADLCLSAILHDIGKVGIPDHILLKPGKLSDEEFDIIKQHALIGGKVLEDAEALNPDRSFLAIGKLVAYHHHEKWDGSGYPFALAGADIPLSSRIVAVADVYDALRSARPYKKAMSHESALGIIAEGSAKHFDPQLVEAFISIEETIAAVPRD
jgi:hypothetical protein